MDASQNLTPRGGDVFFIRGPGWGSSVSVWVQEKLDPSARASLAKFTHVAVAVNEFMALEAVPAPATLENAASDRWLARLLARIAERSDSKQNLTMTKWSDVPLEFGFRAIPIADLAIGAMMKRAEFAVLRNLRAPPPYELFELLAPEIVGRMGSQYSIEALRDSMEAHLRNADGLLVRTIPFALKLRVWLASSFPTWTSKAGDVKSLAGFSREDEKAFNEWVPNAFPNYESRAYYCSQLVPCLLQEASLLSTDLIYNDITPSGLHRSLSGLGWTDVTASDYSPELVEALRLDRHAAKRCGQTYLDWKVEHKFTLDLMARRILVKTLEEGMDRANASPTFAWRSAE